MPCSILPHFAYSTTLPAHLPPPSPPPARAHHHSLKTVRALEARVGKRVRVVPLYPHLPGFSPELRRSVYHGSASFEQAVTPDHDVPHAEISHESTSRLPSFLEAADWRTRLCARRTFSGGLCHGGILLPKAFKLRHYCGLMSSKMRKGRRFYLATISAQW